MVYVIEFETEKNIAQMLSKLAMGEEFIITNEGKPVAELKPMGDEKEDEDALLTRREKQLKK